MWHTYPLPKGENFWPIDTSHLLLRKEGKLHLQRRSSSIRRLNFSYPSNDLHAEKYMMKKL